MSHTSSNIASPYSTYADTPFQIHYEGQTVVVTFVRKSPSTGTISWTFPQKVSGCDPSLPQAYNGALITLDTTPTDPSKFPKNGSQYIADTSTNRDVHMGDKLGSSLVIGAFYNDVITNSVDVFDLDPSTPYYISLHAVDAQFRYYTSGVHSYSLDFGNTVKQGTPGTQIVTLGENGVGVLETDSTGLDGSATYTVKMKINFKEYEFEFDGSDIQTYANLISEWNIKASLMDAPQESLTVPNLNGLFYDKKNLQLFQWNGTQENLLTGVYSGQTDPLSIVNGTISYNVDTKTVNKYNGTNWIPQLTYHTDFEPNDPSCGFIWFDTSSLIAYSWIGVWAERPTFVTPINPSLPITYSCVTYWYNSDDGMLSKFDPNCGKWESSLAIVYPTDPTTLIDGVLWMDEKNTKLNTLVNGVWVNDKVVSTVKTSVSDGQFWFDAENGIVQSNIAGTFTTISCIVWYQNPLDLKSGTLWWDTTNDELYMRQKMTNTWVIQTLITSETDPRFPILEVGTVWINNSTGYLWDGGEFVPVKLVSSPSPINQYTDDLAWVKRDGTVWILSNSVWTLTNAIQYNESMFTLSDGDYWFNTSTNVLYQLQTGTFVPVPYSNKSLIPAIGFTYFNTFLNKLQKWNGYGWVDGDAPFKVFLNSKGNLQFETLSVGSGSLVQMEYMQYGADGYYGVGTPPDIFTSMVPQGFPLKPVEGGDPQSSKPEYQEIGIGTDGSEDERREMIDSIRFQLGYPQVEVELSKIQMETALTNALETFRQRSGMAYNHGFMFIDLEPNMQHYKMTNKRLNHHKIVSINKIYRVNSSFLSVAQGQGVYGQMALQQMYQMGSFDLVSYHLTAQYVETMNELFAANIMFKFSSDTRTLSIFKNFFKPERVLMEVRMERTEQDLIKDRYIRQWIQGYAKAQCRMMLSEIRGKYTSLPGAGGGVSLNGAEQSAKAEMEIAMLLQELDDFIVTNPEDYAGSTMIFA